jgi:hypothetical protein|tara:strand:- start:4500 stop:4745 length:246 start_codon:yes stop_codon:yes gene_type:complete
MNLGDLVKFVENHGNGVSEEVIGLVVEEKGRSMGRAEKPIYRVRWFKKDSPDSWHVSPKECKGNTAKDFYIISSVKKQKKK